LPRENNTPDYMINYIDYIGLIDSKIKNRAEKLGVLDRYDNFKGAPVILNFFRKRSKISIFLRLNIENLYNVIT
jgi:hypothetical protein